MAATVGLLTRSATAAVVVAVVGYAVVLFVLATQLRAQYLPMLSATAPATLDGAGPALPDGAWAVQRGYLDGSGRFLGLAEVYRGCAADAVVCQARAGVVSEVTSYQPADRYWPFQLIETGILLGVSAVVLAAGRLGLRRATAP